MKKSAHCAGIDLIHLNSLKIACSIVIVLIHEAKINVWLRIV